MLKTLPFMILAIGLSLPAFMIPDQFELPKEFQIDGNAVTADVAPKIEAAKSKVSKQNRMLLGAMIGVAIVGCLGLGAGVIAGRSAATSAIVGLILGGALGGIGGYGTQCLVEYFRENPMDVFVESISIHSSIFLALGVALSVAVLVSRVCDLKTAVTVLLASALAAVLYPFLAAIAFPLLRSDQFPPDGTLNRTLWLVLPTILFSLVIGRSMKPKIVPSPSSEASGGQTTHLE